MKEQRLSLLENREAVRDLLFRYRMWVVLLFILIVSTILSKGVFIRPENIWNLVLQNAIIGIIAMGQFLVILTAGIDLSVGSVFAASSMICALLLAGGQGIVLSILAALAVGSALGFANGIMVSKGKIPPFIATLGMMGIARSLAREVNNNSPIWAIPDNFLLFGREYVGPVPVAGILWFIVFFFTLFLVGRTQFGRYLYAVGSNENATRLSGIKIDRAKLLAYTLTGLFCGIAVLVYIGRTKYSPPEAGVWYNLDSIAAVAIGGASLAGGVGTVGGTLLGVVIVGVLTNMLNILNVHVFWQQVVKGIVLLSAVYVNGRAQAR